MKYKNLVITQNAKLFQSIRPILICADLDVSQATTYQKAFLSTRVLPFGNW